MLRTFESSSVERVDRPRIDRAVAEGGRDAVDNLGHEEVPVVIRVEEKNEHGGVQRASAPNGHSTADRVGKRAGRHVGQKSYKKKSRGERIGVRVMHAS